MSQDEPPQHLHLLSSFELGWRGVNLIYELEPADEMPETYLSHHFIVLALGDFRASYWLDGRWQHIDYAKGELAILPAAQSVPKVQVDREVPLLELFLDPATLAQAAGEAVEINQIELLPHLQTRDPLIQQMGLALMTELKAGGADSQLYAESMAIALSAHLMRRYATRCHEQSNRGGLPKYLLKRSLSYIHEHLDQRLTLAELAATVQMSPHYFATLFKQSVGMTPYQYVMQCRIEKAKQLLSRQDLAIVEICQEVGFQNQSHFTRVFRQHTTMTPKTYRDSL